MAICLILSHPFAHMCYASIVEHDLPLTCLGPVKIGLLLIPNVYTNCCLFFLFHPFFNSRSPHDQTGLKHREFALST